MYLSLSDLDILIENKCGLSIYLYRLAFYLAERLNYKAEMLKGVLDVRQVTFNLVQSFWHVELGTSVFYIICNLYNQSKDIYNFQHGKPASGASISKYNRQNIK